MKIFQFITFYIKLQQVQNHCVLGLIKQMDLLYLLKVKLNISILFDYGSFNKICDMIKYLISKKSEITNSINYSFAKIRIGSYNTLSIKNTITFHKVITLIKQLLIKIKINTTIICYQKNVCININPKSNIF